MKFTVQRSVLLEALNITGKAVNTNSIIPILSSILFKITGNECEVCASNQEVFLSKKIEVISDTDISIALPALRLTGLIKELPDQPLQFDVDEKSVTIKASSGKYVIPYEDGEHFPVFNIKDTPVSFTMNGQELLNGVDKSLFAASIDISHSLCGVAMDISEGEVSFTGCNSFILSTVTSFIENTTVRKTIIPIKTATILNGLTINGDVEISVYKNNISLNVGNGITIHCILSENKYPDYKGIIPTDGDKLMVVNRLQLLASLKRITQFSDNIISLVTLKITNSNLVVSSNNDTLGESGHEELEVVYDNEPIDININSKLFIQCLQHMEYDNVYMILSDKKRAIVFKSEEFGIEKTKNVMLTMPVTI